MDNKQYVLFLDALSSEPPKWTDDPEVNFYVDKHLDRMEGFNELPDKFEDLSPEEQEIYLNEALLA